MASPNSSKGCAIYFGYGSNLWIKQMNIRCPESTLLGIGRLGSYNWIINERGYANVTEINASNPPIDTRFPETWGLVYKLSETDEKRLDRNEGVPYAYTKESLDVDFWPAEETSETKNRIDVMNGSQKRKMLVYVDRKRLAQDQPQKEYIYRMNMGIEDALKLVVPNGYIEHVVRKFIPINEDLDDQNEKLALKQSQEFQDPGTYNRDD
jgi:gamma-glutamylcyclotransferase